MKTLKTLIALMWALPLMVSCDHHAIRASGEVTSLNYSIPNYSTLKVSSAFNAYVTFSDTEESIRIEANENLHKRIVVKRDGNSLVIKLKTLTHVRGNATLNAYITTKNISEFDMAGASHLTLDSKWLVQDGKVELTGASEFTGEVSAQRLEFDMRGASNANIYGNVDELYADLSGASNIMDYDLLVERLNIEMSGASEGFLSVNESIDIEARGASTLNYKGDAVITNKELAGSSEIRKRD